MATTYLQRTVSTTGSRRKATFSAWIKKSGTGEQWFLNSGGNNSTGYNTKIGFGSDDEIFIINSSGSTNLRYQTSRKLRDLSAWYHIVVAFDTDNSTSGDRVKVYINGNRETSFFNVTTPSQYLDLEMNQNTSSKNLMAIGTRYNSGDLFNGLMSHVHWIDGTAYDASAFGSTDSVTAEWQINTSPSVTYGTNGFFILKDGNSVTDQSGQSNNLTVGAGTLTKTEDCPSNVFATANALTNLNGSATYSEGNLKVSGGNAANNVWQTTLGVSSGKWYWELKNLISDSDLSLLFYDQSIISGSHPGYGFVCSTKKKVINGSVTGSAIGSSAQNDIWSMALDLDNGKMFIARNGTYLESGNPSTGANPFIQTSDGLPSEGVFGGHAYNGSVQLNFGNGYFGTTAVSSAGTNASGIGIFEYDVPANFTALSTKGLNL